MNVYERRAQAAKTHSANKTRAHNANHARALTAHKAGKKPHEIQAEQAAAKAVPAKSSKK